MTEELNPLAGRCAAPVRRLTTTSLRACRPPPIAWSSTWKSISERCRTVAEFDHCAPASYLTEHRASVLKKWRTTSLRPR